jgi:crossover junction endodeoxyribonuclease RusA
MSDYEFTMPFPPSVNSWKSPFRNRMILTKRGRDYRVKAIERLKEIGLSDEGIINPVSVELVLNPPSLRRYDIDNFCKSLFDALSLANFWNDDAQVIRLLITKGEKVKGGRVDIKVSLSE